MRGVVLSLLLIISITGCAPKPRIIKETVEVPVQVKCKIPEVPRAELEEPLPEDDYQTLLRKLIHNYGRLKREVKELREAIKICQ